MKTIPKNLINAAGTLTSLGGCRTRPEVIAVMAEIAGEFVPFAELHRKAGQHLALILGVEAAMITSGAAAGLTLATAACMVGDDSTLASQLPTPPPKHKVIIQCCHRNPFERSIHLAGATLIQIGDSIRTRPQDLESALNEDVAAIAFFLQGEMLDSSLHLAETIEISHAHSIPVIVDAAAELPPKENLWVLAKKGADLVVFSGSKDLRGPQTSGLLVGRSNLISRAMAQTAPNEHVIGRPMKAGKEIVAGMVAAVEQYLAEDEAARFVEWERIATYIMNQLGDNTGLILRQFSPTQPFIQPACIPRVGISLKASIRHTPSSLRLALYEGDPPIYVEVVGEELWINVHTLTITEAELIVKRINSIII